MKAHRSPPKRSHVQTTSYEGESRILSHEEKHELIRAHAATRQKQPRGYGLGYYIAVAASCLVVATGWIMTLDRGLWRPVKEPDPIVNEISDSAEKLKQQIDKTTQNLEEARKQFEAASKNVTTTR